jgi:integrase
MPKQKESKKQRGQGEGSIYQLEDGRWRGAVSIGWQKNEDGKPVWKRRTVTRKTKYEVQEELKTILREQQQGLPIKSDRQTVGRFLDGWLEGIKASVRPRTHDSYNQIIKLYLKPAVGDVLLQKLTAQHVQGLMNDRLTAGLSPRSVQYCFAVLRRALNQAVKWDLVPRNVALLAEPPKVERKQIHPFTPEESRAFLEAVKGDRLEALYSVALAIGLREGEALALRWSDVDFDNGTLAIRHTLQKSIEGAPILAEPKTDRSRRTIKLPAVAVAALLRHRALQTEERRECERWQDHDLVFTSPIGTALDPSNLIKQFHAILRAADLRQIRFHDLRHTAATLLLAQGVHPRLVMDLLGHSQISLTLDTYSHVIPQMREQVADQMDAILNPVATQVASQRRSKKVQ